jgi:hypothetical protein
VCRYFLCIVLEIQCLLASCPAYPPLATSRISFSDALPCAAQVCGFIALYLRLAEIAHTTAWSQPVHMVSPTALDRWQKLMPDALIAGLSIWSAMQTHQTCHELFRSLTPQVQSNPSALKLHRAASAMADMDSAAHSLYVCARQHLLALSHLFTAPPGSNTSCPESGSRHVVVQLQQLLGLVYKTTKAYAAAQMESHLMRSVELAFALRELSKSCQQLSELACVGSSNTSWDPHQVLALISAATAMAGTLPCSDPFIPMHPALLHSDDQEWLPKKGGPPGEPALDFPTPASILRAFPPPPLDPEEWATFYHTSCPVSPRLPSKFPVVAPPRNIWFEEHCHPPACASAQDVSQFVSMAKAQLGASFCALAPVAAAIRQRPEPWVSDRQST